MWDKIAKVIVWATPILAGIWKLMDRGSKIAVVCIAFVAVTIWGVIVSYSTIKIDALNAFDSRFDSLYKERETARIEAIKALETDVSGIKTDIHEMKSDVRDMRNVLMRSPR